MPSPDPPPAFIGTAASSLLNAFYTMRTDSGVRTAMDDLRMFAKFCVVESSDDIESLLFGPTSNKEAATSLVTKYREYMLTQKLARGTIKRRLSVIRGLSKLAETTGLVSWHVEVPTDPEAPQQPKPPQRPKVRFRESQSAKSRRDTAISLVAQDLRLTHVEITAFDLENYRPGRAVGAFEVQRNGQRLVMQIGPDATRAMSAWLERRGLKPGPMFPKIDEEDRVQHAHRIAPAP